MIVWPTPTGPFHVTCEPLMLHAPLVAVHEPAMAVTNDGSCATNSGPGLSSCGLTPPLCATLAVTVKVVLGPTHDSNVMMLALTPRLEPPSTLILAPAAAGLKLAVSVGVKFVDNA